MVTSIQSSKASSHPDLMLHCCHRQGDGLRFMVCSRLWLNCRPPPLIDKDCAVWLIFTYGTGDIGKKISDEETARKHIYLISTAYYYSFGCIIPIGLSNKIGALDCVFGVFPDCVVSSGIKDYGVSPNVGFPREGQRRA
ncbi:multiple organellar RNA editing factor 6, mitochondrial-like isoform X3 [Tasmannia lanceolata]|uniref:multiple organellar RNA editing factor 6, mitochondrial-like isoform X3 n=1 Tax=Tasmannia lanceolata TaxID=3420 RepID=UPI00406414E6